MSYAVVKLSLAIVALVSNSPALAAWPSDAVTNVPMCVAPHMQFDPAAVCDRRGGIVSAWDDSRVGAQVYASHVGSDGFLVAGWSATGNLLSAGGAAEPRLIGLDDGRFVCAFNNGPGPRLVCFDSAGVSSWGSAGVLATSHSGTMDALCSDGDGGCLVGWEDPRAMADGTSEHLFAQRFGPDGLARWTTDGALIAVRHSSTIGQAEGAMCSDGVGGALVAWYGGPDHQGDIRAQKLDALGVPQWSDSGIIVCGAPGRQSEPSVISDLQGGAYIGWTDYRSNSLGDAYFQHVLADGSVASGWLMNGRPLANNPAESNTRVVLIPDGVGGVIAAWKYGRVRMQHYSFLGDSLWGAAPIQLMLAQGFSVDGDGDGGALVVAVYTLSDGDIYAQRVNASGQPLWGGADGVPVCTATGTQGNPVIASNGSGGGVAVWVDQRNEGSGGDSGDIYAQNINSNGSLGGDVVATLLSLAGADASPERVSVRWFTSERSVASAVVERNAGDGWVAVGQVSPDGEGILHYDDTMVVPGTRYGYRLELTAAGRTQALGETWIQVPLLAEFALKRLQPNPSTGPITVAFSLPDAAPVTIELLDISGRQIESRDVGILGAGSHVATFPASGRVLPPGVYAVRLRRGTQSLSARAVVIR